jgi:hypothetical protein
MPRDLRHRAAKIRSSHKAYFLGAKMDHAYYTAKTTELDDLLNDPDVPMDPARIWALLAELAKYDNPSSAAIGKHGHLPA